MSNTSLVSIIIPTFNREHLIGETLDSVLSQTYTNWECIVVDDGSTDATENIVKGYIKKDQKIQYYNRPNNRPKGANACRNFGFEKSKGDFINWIDSDDVITTEHVMLHVNTHSQTNADCVVTNAETFKDTINNKIHHWSNIHPVNDVVLEMIQTKTLWAIGAVSWKRNSVNNLPFDERLSSSQEWTFHLKQMIDKKTYNTLNATTYLARSHDARIGKDVSQPKCYSTFMSRLIIFNTLISNKQLTKAKEKGLLEYMFKSLRFTIENGYNTLLFTLIKMLLKQLGKTSYKIEVLKKVFFSVPVYKITGKGHKLFNIN